MTNNELEIVEEILEGKISTNPNRFESANGIVFTLNQEYDSPEIREYFNSRGVEYHELNDGSFYTETVMTGVEFVNLQYVQEYIQIA
ncbi:hypothetical protein [Paenibacillus periandrae]|uniref:hypothetical protein n=1 Tax=Paenibacillus periandrae TaxID=1761741 RepID=UPI001F089C8C|nr:hypothetical protein [Paenibacillus periandrae]